MNTCVVHLTPATGMQASARIARFLAETLRLPLVDDLKSLEDFQNRANFRLPYTTIMVNGPIAFCGIRDELGDKLLRSTERLLWVQNDYTITLPPNQAYSRPTKAETPFRVHFHRIPNVSTWSTCQDVLRLREWRGIAGWRNDMYVDWNALTYAPLQPNGGPKPTEGLCYYGALRAGRKDALKRLLHGVPCNISASKLTTETEAAWDAITDGAGRVLRPVVKEDVPVVTINNNKHGVQPLLNWIADHRHSLYVADEDSNAGHHSLANRFYEVLSAPHTVLWLDAAGESTYRKYELKKYEAYMVADAAELKRKLELPPAKLWAMALFQRAEWLAADPYKKLLATVRKYGKMWS